MTSHVLGLYRYLDTKAWKSIECLFHQYNEFYEILLSIHQDLVCQKSLLKSIYWMSFLYNVIHSKSYYLQFASIFCIYILLVIKMLIYYDLQRTAIYIILEKSNQKTFTKIHVLTMVIHVRKYIMITWLKQILAL